MGNFFALFLQGWHKYNRFFPIENSPSVIKQWIQNKYGKHPAHFQVYPQCLLHRYPNTLIHNLSAFQDLSSSISLSWSMMKVSTSCSKHLEVFQAFRWTPLVRFVFLKAIGPIYLYQWGLQIPKSLEIPRNKIHKQHGSQPLAFLQRLHQYFDNLVWSLSLLFN